MFRWQTYAAAIVVIAAVLFSFYEPADSSLEPDTAPLAGSEDNPRSPPLEYIDTMPSQPASNGLNQPLLMEMASSDSESDAEDPVYGDQLIGDFEDPDGVEFDPADGVVQVIGEPLDADGDDFTYEPSDLSLPEDPDASAFDGGYGIQIIGEIEDFDAPSLVDEETIQIIGEPEEFEPPL